MRYVRSAAVRSKAVVLLLFLILCCLLFPMFVVVVFYPCFVTQYLLSFLVLQSSR